MLPQAVRWLAREWTGAGPLDLADRLVVVPTKQAGRRLRAALAEHAAGRGQAVFAPRVVTPEWLVAPGAEEDVAPRLQTMLAWAQVLLGLELDACRAVFPVDPPVRDFAWALRLAEQFTALQRTLGESGLTLAEVAARTPSNFGERLRWEQLGELGRRHAATLARAGWREPQAARLATASTPPPLDGVARIVVLAVPDPLPLALTALAAHARTRPVDVVVFAPEREADHFDAWGRPVPEAWRGRSAPFADFSAQVHLLPDATAQAGAIADLASRHAAPDGVLALGVADPTLTPLLAGALERAGRPAFDPAGERHDAHGFYAFLTALAAFAREALFGHVIALARAPEIVAWLRAELDAAFTAERWLAQLDALHAKHLPATLADALRHARADRKGDFAVARAGLEQLAALRDLLEREKFGAGAEQALTRIFAARTIDPTQPADRRFRESAATWGEVMRLCAEAAENFPGVARDAWWELALRLFGAERREAEKPAGALELQGWLELPYEDAPHVVVAGVNDGAVPEAVTGDVFLPESLRTLLGLKTNDARFARDAYLLHALVASRRAAGRVDVLVGKVSTAGEPLRPSRLLLQCDDAELPARIAHLFRPLGSRASLPAWERSWKLRPRRAPLPTRLSPTSFRSYLACPFRFYLKHVLGMDAVDAEKRELDVFDFGSLCHDPLEKLADAAWRDCTDERALADFLVAEFDRVAVARFGPTPAVPLVAQLESARQRLRAAARVQAAERAAGWVIHAVERPFQIDFGGLVLSGRIDRIDRHAETGAWRVIDYKTSDTPKPPADAHLATPRDGAPDWTRVTVGGRERQWVDLQLPLYLHALPLALPGAEGRASCGYFNLPKAAASTALAAWDDYPPDLHAAALRCAEEIAAAVRAGKFWPPNEDIRPEQDDFGALFHRGAADSIAWEVTP